MARGEAYAIVLADQERSELEHRAACYTLPHKRVQRAKLVLYAAGGATNAEIARRLEMNADVVGRWRKRFHDERLPSDWKIRHQPPLSGFLARPNMKIGPSCVSRAQRISIRPEAYAASGTPRTSP
jgi:transposase-like protein